MYNINIGNQGKIMRKLLGKPSVDSPHDSPSSSSAAAPTSSPLVPNYRPAASQNAVYSTGVPIGCIDRSPDGRSAVLAGRHVLKTINFDGLSIRDGIDLRALLTARPATGATGNTTGSVADQLSIKDVKWGTGHASNTIFTACASGKIFQYDLTRIGSNATGGTGIDFIQIREDNRQVNALDINPHRSSFLLSGSQDGFVRLIDIRIPIPTRYGPTYRASAAFKCNADGVRHVQWSTRDGFFFACGTEQGAVLKWDIRKGTAPLLRINAHEKMCSSIAWHPDGDHLISAGWDSKCHIWDMNSTNKRQKAKWTLSTPAPVATLAWRPGQWSATAQGKRASQVAVSYDESSQKRFGVNAVHIWDLARPTMPYREIQRFDSSPNAMLWHDQYLLWTAGQDGLFNQCDVTFAPKVIDRQAVSTMSFSSQGDVVMFLDERAPSHRPRPHILHPDSIAVPSYSSSPTAPKFSVSRSDSEDDVVGSFLGPKRRGSRKRRPSRSAASLSTTPPTNSNLEDVMSLDQTIKVTGTYKPQQAMAIGRVPAAAKVDIYAYLTTNYLETLYRELPSRDGRTVPDRISTILAHYAKAAESVNQFRLAQTWKILAYGIDLVLRRRGQYHLEVRMELMKKALSKKKSEHKLRAFERPFELSVNLPSDGEQTPRKVLSTSSLDKGGHPRSLLAEELESTSNVPTPLARPIPDSPNFVPYSHSHDNGRGKKLTPIIEPESFTLPPAMHSYNSRKRLDSVPVSVDSHDSENSQASLEGYDFYDTEAINKAIDVPDPHSPNHIRNAVLRHDSNESFAQVFSTSETSSKPTMGLASSSDSSIPTHRTIAESLNESTKATEGSEREYDSSRRRSQVAGAVPVRQGLERTETGLTAYTDEHLLITQTDSFDSPYPSQPDNYFDSPQRRGTLVEPDIPAGMDSSPHIVETDYLRWANDPPYPYPIASSPDFSMSSSQPLQPYSLIARALAFEAKSSALNAAAIILLFRPLVPEDVIDSFQAAAILRQHHSRLMSMRLFVEAALLRKLCMKGWPGGDLVDWGDNYPAIFTPAQQGVQVGFSCSSCQKPREIDRTSNSTQSIWKCERCRAVMAPCAVCGHRDTTPNLPPAPVEIGMANFASKSHMAQEEEEEPVLATWWYCPGCGHGGHSTCLQGWHASFEAEHSAFDSPPDPAALEASSEGYCPLDGCGHACIPGRWRVDSAAARSEEVSRAVREATRGAGKLAAANAAEFLSGQASSVAAETAAYHPDHPYIRGARVGTGVLLHEPPSGYHQYQNSSSGGAGGGGVRSDSYDVAPTRAVETVREALAFGPGGYHRASTGDHGSTQSSPRGGGGGGGGGGMTSSILSASPGRSSLMGGGGGAGHGGIGGDRDRGAHGSGHPGPERERRKSVKFAGTTEH